MVTAESSPLHIDICLAAGLVPEALVSKHKALIIAIQETTIGFRTPLQHNLHWKSRFLPAIVS